LKQHAIFEIALDKSSNQEYIIRTNSIYLQHNPALYGELYLQLTSLSLESSSFLQKQQLKTQLMLFLMNWLLDLTLLLL